MDIVALLAPRIAQLRAAFRTARPFPHVIIDDVLPQEEFQRLEASMPTDDVSAWYRYSNPLEKKLACNRFQGPVLDLVQQLNSGAFGKLLASSLGYRDMIPDPDLTGAGLHMILTGGKLDLHLDHNINENLPGFTRRINLIYWIHNIDWQESWGGQLELWSERDGKPHERVQVVTPRANRMILFECSDRSFHGHPDPMTCPTWVARKSIAVYYYTSEPSAEAPRYKVHFCARPTDPPSVELDELRRLRAQPGTAGAVYRYGM